MSFKIGPMFRKRVTHVTVGRRKVPVAFRSKQRPPKRRNRTALRAKRRRLAA